MHAAELDSRSVEGDSAEHTMFEGLYQDINSNLDICIKLSVFLIY